MLFFAKTIDLNYDICVNYNSNCNSDAYATHRKFVQGNTTKEKQS